MGYEALGLQADEILDHSVLTLQKGVSGMPAWEDIAEQIRQLEVFTFIGRHLRKDGSEFPVEVNTTTFHQNEKVFFLLRAILQTAV